jgi:hypothetical protein
MEVPIQPEHADKTGLTKSQLTPPWSILTGATLWR